MGHQARRLREHHRQRPSHRNAYFSPTGPPIPFSGSRLKRPPPRVSASAFPDDAPWDDRQQLCPGQEHIVPVHKVSCTFLPSPKSYRSDDFENTYSPGPMLDQSSPRLRAWNQFTDPNNTTVFIGGLSGYVTKDELRSFFQGFGEITYVKTRPGEDELVEWMMRSIEGNPPWCCGRYNLYLFDTYSVPFACVI
ncbi:hypothetical protein J4E86_006125 [Alternaria arbusti]|uniref:uncharacterized protein n=1 Tax=Alternaria arbusti TaxID=232088 RepID=UPI0022200FD4|nr:uncharacterized protein J4E86_006125 [Alternaria arbusti]KAI4954815.1 hypothetical protein J4E86_006125 [Alternaria arbusti]